MGEIAEMMIDGTLCAGCGVYLHGDGDGMPRYCHSCRHTGMNPLTAKKHECPFCSKRFKTWAGVQGHAKDVHGEVVEAKPKTPPPAPRADKTNCPTCGARVKKSGLAAHTKAKHTQGSQP